MLAGLANAYIDNPKLDVQLCKTCSYYNSASVPKRPQKQSNLKISGGACPQAPSLASIYSIHMHQTSM